MERWRELELRPAKVGLPYSTTLNADEQFSLRIHYGHRMPTAKEARHSKVDFTDTRLLSADDLLMRLTSLFRVSREQAMSFRVVRIDFTADVYGVPVEWFRQHCRVKRKRKPRSYEVSESETSRGAMTSVIFGKRPDLYRIYDRVAALSEVKRDALFGSGTSSVPLPVVTRVERQCNGKAIPRDLSTLGGLFEHAAEVDPFPALVCRQTNTDRIASDNWPPQRRLMKLGLAAAVQELGEATVRARLNRTGGNAKRIFDRYSDLLRSVSAGVTVAELRDQYRRRTIRQLNWPVVGVDGKLTYPAGGLTLTL
jgi:hypothetical protein